MKLYLIIYLIIFSDMALARSPDPKISTLNSSTTPLAGDATFTGTWESCFHFRTMVATVSTDVQGTLKMQFSTDASNIDSSLPYDVQAGVFEPPHKLEIFRRYCRLVYENGSAAQTYLRLHTMYADRGTPVSPLNLAINPDADASITRNISTEFTIGTGLFTGVTKVHKFGENSDVDSGTLPEDIWEGGGVYTGFPSGSSELVEVVSSSTSDDLAGSGAEKVHIYGLDANGLLQDEEITLDGQTPVDSASTYSRVFRAIVTQSNNGANDGFNAGIITVRHTTTTANVFAAIPIGVNQTRVCAYTIPSDKTGFLRDWAIHVDKSQTANLAGELYIKETGKPPRYIRHWQASNANNFDEYIYSAITFPASTDIVVRVTSSSGSNVDVTCKMDLFLVDNI